MDKRTNILIAILYILLPLMGCGNVMSLQAQPTYGANRPVIIVSDWDKPPYEFRDDHGKPAGFYVDVLTTILNEMGIPYEFQMMECSKAMATFEQGKADLIFDNVRKYTDPKYAVTSNIISYYRVSVATTIDSTIIIPTQELENPKNAVFYHGGYAARFFEKTGTAEAEGIHPNYQSPKEALIGVVKGKYKYFVWNEEALKWKMKEYDLTNDIKLHEVNIPTGDIHIIGYDKQLIETIDDKFSRLRQSGEIDKLSNKWFRGIESKEDHTIRTVLFIIGTLAVLAAIILFFIHLAKAHIRLVTRNSTEISQMMDRALHMGNFHVMQYDIANDLMTNHYGNLLPEGGITLEEFVQRIYPDEQDEFTRKMRLLLSGRERKFELEKRWNAGSNESPKWLRFHGHAIIELDKEGHPEYVLNAIHDITHNVEEEKANRELHHRFESLFNIPGLAMSFYNHEGWLITLNERMKQLCGFENPDNERFWTTMNMYDIPLFRDAYPPESGHNLQACQVMEYPEMGIKNYIEFHVMPIRNEQGKITQYLDASLDLNKEHEIYASIDTQTKQLELTRQQLDIHEQRLHHLLSESHIYIYDFDLNTQTFHFSHSLRHTDHSITFDEYLDMVDDDEREEAQKQFTECEDPFTLVRHFKYTVTSHDPKWMCYIGRKKYDEQGNHTGFAGIAIDITDFIETQNHLRETAAIANDSIRLKNVFLASMTHELRTPLNAIVGFTTVLKVTDDPAERQELIDIINSSCDTLQRLINDILETSSITSEGAASIKPENVDFVRAFDNICFTLQHRITQAGIEFVKDNPYEHFFTTVDIDRIQQIVTNFVTNAIKFTTEGHIKLGYRYEQHGLHIYCEDTGIGIPQDKHEIIFERFVKLDEFTQGTGMGLAICKEIAKRMGGRIGVKSEGSGKGSTLWVWIPCERRLTPHAETEKVTETASKA